MMNEQEATALTEALAVTAEMTGTGLSHPTLKAMVERLAGYPFPRVMTALHACQTELSGRLTLAAIIERIDDGYPDANAAWGMIPQDEHGSVVWCDEMAAALGYAQPLLDEGDPVAARMAFLGAYRDAVRKARSEGRTPRWWLSPGRDPSGRETAVRDAVSKGRLTHERARQLVPSLPPLDPAMQALANTVAKGMLQ